MIKTLHRYLVSLELTTLEFDGLVDTLREFAYRFAISQRPGELTEDDLLLGDYCLHFLTPTRRGRRTRQLTSSKRGKKRYQFSVDYAFVRAIYRVLQTTLANNERQALLARLYLVLIDADALPSDMIEDRIPLDVVQSLPHFSTALAPQTQISNDNTSATS